MSKPKGPFDEAIMVLRDRAFHNANSPFGKELEKAVSVLEAAGKTKVKETDGAFGICFEVEEGQFLNVTALLKAIWEAGK